MAELPTRAANRLRKPSWRDSRLIAGVLIVLVSTLGGAVFVSQMNERVPVYAVKGVLMPGDQINASNLVRVDVQLGSQQARYVSATQNPPEGFALREIRDGELLPVTAIGAKDKVDVQPVTIQVDATSATALVRGSVVDVYVNPPKPGSTTQEFAGPKLLVERAGVVAQPDEGGGLGGGLSDVAVRILVPSDKVSGLIANIDMGARVTVVPVPGSPTRTS